ncbi:hypothetical protein K440DRAFT_647420 [Wilcoxina mikolae CBS 423.85]|nr:hypothetical protein K440DRAFT_647420 [Wilcoxina mikolae CBS 423.85]
MRIQEDELDHALHNLYNYYEPTISYIRQYQWTIQNPEQHFFHDDQDFIEYLRWFSKVQLQRILLVLDLESIEWTARNRPSPEFALCLVLHRLSAEGFQFKDEIKIFGYSRSYLSLKLLHWDEGRLTAVKIQEYVQAVEVVADVCGVWSFIDGTMRPFCRPGDNQQDYYSGHKKHHGFQFQCIMTPDGLMSSFHRPYMGPTGDWLRELLVDEDRVAPYYLYGDLAYWPAFGIMGPYPKRAANVTISSVRIIIEWGFGLNIGSSPVALYYIILTLFTHFHTCLHGQNLVSDRFHLEPPTLEEYVNSIL